MHPHFREDLNISDWVKREAGESPARTRRCKRGAVFPQRVVSRRRKVKTMRCVRNVPVCESH